MKSPAWSTNLANPWRFQSSFQLSNRIITPGPDLQGDHGSFRFPRNPSRCGQKKGSSARQTVDAFVLKALLRTEASRPRRPGPFAGTPLTQGDNRRK